jgi:hypothetical protein
LYADSTVAVINTASAAPQVGLGCERKAALRSQLLNRTCCTIIDTEPKELFPAQCRPRCAVQDKFWHPAVNREKMAKRPIDRRVARSRDMLHQALLILIVKKGYDAITVEDICETANVGRSTFYAHFTS